MSNVLVTGGTGFLAGWITRKLLEQGHTVRVSVRSDAKGDLVKSMLEHEGADCAKYSYAIAELGSTDGWDAAMAGIDYVIHAASPLGGEDHNDPTLTDTAKAGALNVLNAAIRNDVKKVVMTSSEAASFPGIKATSRNVDETCWTNLDDKLVTNYMRSKAVAEKAAWDLIGQQQGTALTTILPGAIFGPFMDKRHSSTDMLFTSILGGMPSPKVTYQVVDVRDLADLHVLAMENPKADGQRFIGSNDEITMPAMAVLMKNHLGERGKKIRTMTVPDFVVKIGARFNSAMRVLVTMIGTKYAHTNAKAKTLLGWEPRPVAQTVIDTTDYLLDSGLA